MTPSCSASLMLPPFHTVQAPEHGVMVVLVGKSSSHACEVSSTAGACPEAHVAAEVEYYLQGPEEEGEDGHHLACTPGKQRTHAAASRSLTSLHSVPMGSHTTTPCGPAARQVPPLPTRPLLCHWSKTASSKASAAGVGILAEGEQGLSSPHACSSWRSGMPGCSFQEDALVKGARHGCCLMTCPASL